MKPDNVFLVRAFVGDGAYGNPAGVCLLSSEKETAFYQRVAARVNCPETAFLLPSDTGYNLRWFTPNGTEIDLCGHATLAAAFILLDKGLVDPAQKIAFDTRSGRLTAWQEGDSIFLDFPADEVKPVTQSDYDFHKLLGVNVCFLGRTRFDYFIVAGSTGEIKAMSPDFAALKAIETRGIIVTAASDSPEYDFVSRFFAPRVGVDEDPVTGSAHCALATYWGRVLGKNSLVGYQASQEGGIVRVQLKGERVHLGGQALAAGSMPISEI